MTRKSISLVLTVIGVLVPYILLAQYGPMGIGNKDGTPTPAGPQPRLLLWLDGSNVQRSGSEVTKWLDKSGNGNDFIPDASANRPSYQATGGPASTPCLSFDGVDDRLVCSGFEFPSSGYSIYFIIKSNDDKFGMFSYATTDDTHEINIFNDNGFYQEMGPHSRSSNIGDISTGSWNYGGVWWDNSSNMLWEYNRSNSSSGENSNAFANGFNINPTGTAVIGDIQNSVNGGYVVGDAFDGEIAEIIIWEGTLTKPVGRMMRTYIYTKYGNADGNGSNWDKFQSHAPGSAGEYYTPIGVGRDGGAHYESRLNGLVLRLPSAGGSSYMCAGQVSDAGNTVINSSVAGVDQQWSRAWEISGDNGGVVYEIGFDFGEGINGLYPQNILNYVLLRKQGSGGAYSEFTSIVSKAIVDDEVVFRVNKSNLASSNYYFTIGTKNASASSLIGEAIQTWYAYQSGDWDDPTTWTLDGSAAPTYVNPNSEFPGTGDNVYIGTGRTVNVNVDGINLGTGTLEVFGTLDVGTFSAPAFSSISGSGLIRCAGNGTAGNFPTGNSTAFADEVNGGTAEFYGSGGFTQTSDLVVNKLKINLSSSTATMTLAADLTHNGLFEVNQGTFVVNNSANTPRTLISNARVLVEGNGEIKVSSASGLTKHKWYFYKDLINDGGEVKFTNRTAPSDTKYRTPENQDIIEAFFSSGSNNQELRANGPSYFSRIVIDKGVDMTYILTFSATNANYFKLLGPCNDNNPNNPYLTANQNDNSFVIVNGTAEIRENVFIPLSVNKTNASNYNINATAQLWINGGEAAKGYPVGTNTLHSQAIVNYGLIKVSAGTLTANCRSGITTRGNGITQIDGGVFNAMQFRTSNQGAGNIGGIIINGGVVNIDGRPTGIGTAPDGAFHTYYTFSLTYPGNLFRMTGGELHVTGPTGRGLIFINSDPENTSVSGGTVFVDVSDTDDDYKISSRAAFWNLDIKRSQSGGNNRAVKILGGTSGSGGEAANINSQDLIVRSNLSITGNSPTLRMGTSDNPADLFLYGDLNIASGANYVHYNNTTHFKGSSNSSLTFGGSTPFTFHNVELNKNFNDRKIKIQNGGPSVAMDIRGSLFLEKGYFDNGEKHVEVKGNVINKTQFGDESSTGYLRMNGSTGRQDIVSDGGIFYNLRIDNASGVALQNDGVTIRKSLTLDQGSFFIGDKKLRIESTIASPIASSNSTDRFIVCSGNASAGGIEILNHQAVQHLVYPFGVSTGSGIKYTPADVYVNSGWSDDGYIRITPVDTLLSTSDISGGADYLNYYWRVSSSDYTTPPNVTHLFEYDEADIRPLSGGNESNFESGRVLSILPFDRSIDNAPASAHVNTSSNLIYYNGSDQAQGTTGTGTPLVNADYSAGAADRFTGSPDVFFSRSDTVGAGWDTPGNWNKLSECSGCNDVYDYHSINSPGSSEYPGPGDIAFIGFNTDGGPPRPHVYSGMSGGINVAEIRFTPLQERYNGSAEADLGILRPALEVTHTADIINVRQISGEGELLLKGNVDLGVTDIGGFLAEDSSLIVVNTATPVTLNFLPPSIPNLFLAETNATITSDLHVRGNLEVAGVSRLFLSESLGGNIEIDGDLILDKYQAQTSDARVLFNKRGNLKTLEVHGDVKLLGTKAYIGINTFAGAPVTPVPWTPDEVGAQLWFDASDAPTVQTSVNKVTQWNNKGSGSAFNAIQTNTTEQPVYQPSGFGGKPTIHFDGNDDFLSIANHVDLNISANQDFELFSVVKSDLLPSEAAIIAKGGVDPGDYMLYFYTPKYKFYMDHNALSMEASGGVGTNANMGWARRQGNNGYLYNTLSGSQSDGTAGSASSTGNSHDLTIGAMNDGNARFFDGDIAEIILVRHALTNEERQQMEGYLAHKWGLQDDLPTGHPYKNERPFIGGSGAEEAQLIVDGDIIQNVSGPSTDNGMDLYHIITGFNADTAFANLVVNNSGANEFNNIQGPTPKLWKLKVDKGTDISSSFTFNTNVVIAGPADEPEKPVNIQNGLLKFNHPSIDVTLSSGGGDFVIPETGGLELDAGNLKINGDETGLLLSGSLKIDGGSLKIGATDGQNNYIEYAASGAPKINISGGTLTVGSQIRRGLSSTGGALDYRQSGGDVVIGKYSAPANNRGMLEVLNPGSRFDHTGGTITFVRGVSLGSTPSLFLNPADATVSDPAEIIIGNADSPSGAQIENFGINTNIPLNKLTINNDSGNDPKAHLISNTLVLKGKLTIEQNSELICGDRNLTLYSDVVNDGLLSSAAGKVTFFHSGTSTVDGIGVYDLYDLDRNGGGAGNTLVNVDLLVNHNLNADGGTMSFGSNTLTVKGDVVVDGHLKFMNGSNGLILNGGDAQILKRSDNGMSQIDILSINNPSGVTIPTGNYHFIIDKNLRLESGVFALTGNLLEMADGSVFTPVNPFSETNMIVTGGAFANYGILLHIPANTQDDIFIPLGIDRYMPVNLDFAQPGFSSGSTASTYLLRLNIPENGVIVEDSEAPNPEIVDQDNVLGMFFSVDGTNIGNGLNMEMKFYYDEYYVQVTNPYSETDYTSAWVHADNTTISKFGSGDVDEANNIITFHFSGDYAGDAYAVDGDYFAGIDDAIPSTIPVYQTVQSGDVNDGLNEYDVNVPGGGAPAGALVRVRNSDVLNFNIDNVNFYRTEIEPGATLKIDATSYHRLGKVSGTGTIHLVGTGTLPSGDYTNFFNCFGGKLIYEGENGDNFEILANVPPIEKVNIIGSTNSDITIAGNDVSICTDLTINGPRVKGANSSILTVSGDLNISAGELNLRQGDLIVAGDLHLSGSSTGGSVFAGNTGTTTIKGDLILDGKNFGLGTVGRETHLEGNLSRTTGTITQGTGGAKLVFDGTTAQTVSGDFTIANSAKIPFIEMNNADGLTLNGNVDVSDTLKLTDGNIFTSAGNMLKLTEDGTDVDPLGGKPSSFVDGPMQWTISNGANERTFPIGKANRYRPLAIANPSANRTWEAQYYDTLGLVQTPVTSMNPATYVPAIETVSIQEHWRVNSNSGGSTSAKVRLSWGDNSAVSTNTGDQEDLLVLGYNTTTDLWDSYGGSGPSYDAPTNQGNIISADPVPFTERFITLGSSSELNPLPVTWLYFRGETDGKQHTLSWATASEADNDYFELERSIDAQNWESIAQITGAGHSTSTRTYSHVDHNPPFGRVYYRIKQVDFDAKSDYAPNIVSLNKAFEPETAKFDFIIYPNPTTNLPVRFRMSNVADAVSRVVISDLSGKMLREDYVQIDGQGTSAPMTCNFEPGIYLVTVIVNDKMKSKPLVITR